MPKLNFGDSVVQLGSCFSTHISEKMRYAGFEVLDNPLGVIFHPIPLANQILLAFGKGDSNPNVQKADVWLSFDASSSVYAMNELQLQETMQERLLRLKKGLLSAKFLFVTMGSAHANLLKENNRVVANCHQQPSQLFQKVLSPANEIVTVWEEVIQLLNVVNPELYIVFTVSPVRYIRDGLIENNLSKAVLFQSINRLKNRVSYFPSFELVNDVLRDYRYFDVDGAHPNELAINFVWKELSQLLFDAQTQQTLQELYELRKMSEHRLLYPESVEAQKFQTSFQKKRENFFSLYPNIHW